MQYLFELCTPRTHSTPDSEYDKNGNEITYKQHIFAPTAGVHCTIFPKLYTVIDDVETIKKL